MFVKEAGEDEEGQRSASRTGVGGVDIQARGAGGAACAGKRYIGSLIWGVEYTAHYTKK